MRKPDFFIVGAPKCGTTSMSEYLKQHPDVFVSEPNEPHFFGADLQSHWSDRFDRYRDREKYLSLFDDARDEKRAGEASPWYLYSRRAASEIKQFNPSASIIIMLRDPVAMVYSLHGQQLYNGNEDIFDFEAALDAEEERRNGRQLPKTAHNPAALLYRDTARYTEQVRRYFEVFGRERVHIIIFDDFIGDTQGVYRETLEFLGVAPDFQPGFEIHNPAKSIRSPVLHRFTVARPEFLSKIKWILPYSLRRMVIGSLEGFNVRKESRPPMSPELRALLNQEFQVEVESLSTLLGRDLTHWCQ